VVEEAAVTAPTAPLECGAVVTFALILAATAVAEFVGRLAPSVGAPACALILGMGVRLRFSPTLEGRRVTALGSRLVLQAAVVLFGATFGLTEVGRVGRTSLVPMLGTMGVALAFAWIAGRALRVESRLQALIGIGTAICGASAIGAVSGMIAATEAEIAYALSTIFAFNVVAVLLYPSVGHLLGLGQHAFGVWAGTAINDTSSVIAAGYTYGHAAGTVAVITKLTRATMIVPIVIALAARRTQREGGGRRPASWRLIPMFIILFLVASAVNTAGLIGRSFASDLSFLGGLLITFALASIGMSTRFRELRRTGVRPLILGAVLWASVGLSGLLFQGAL
jgi:uncharacterized integral membrane protein (TIGR00698 family)